MDLNMRLRWALTFIGPSGPIWARFVRSSPLVRSGPGCRKLELFTGLDNRKFRGPFLLSMPIHSSGGARIRPSLDETSKLVSYGTLCHNLVLLSSFSRLREGDTNLGVRQIEFIRLDWTVQNPLRILVIPSRRGTKFW